MASVSDERQLELFDVTNQPAVKRRREPLSRFAFTLRYDQLVLSGMAALLGVTVVFAFGVERGKQLVRAERVVLARQQGVAAPSASRSEPAPQASQEPASISATAGQGAEKALKKSAPTPSPSKARKEPTRIVSVEEASKAAPVQKVGRSRYAVQVVAFSRPHLAKREMDRLRAKGEPAFLVMREGRTAVYVGPFPSKGNASQKLSVLRPQYQDCFVRTL